MFVLPGLFFNLSVFRFMYACICIVPKVANLLVMAGDFPLSQLISRKQSWTLWYYGSLKFLPSKTLTYSGCAHKISRYSLTYSWNMVLPGCTLWHRGRGPTLPPCSEGRVDCWGKVPSGGGSSRPFLQHGQLLFVSWPTHPLC